MVQIGFDIENQEASSGFEALPQGNYLAIIEETEEKKTNAGTGSYVKVKLRIVEGQYTNRVIFDNLNLDNPNPEAVKIARETLKSICNAVGVFVPNDTVELHNIPLCIKLGHQTYNGELQNTVKGYASAKTVADSTAPSSPTNQQANAPAPWKK